MASKFTGEEKKSMAITTVIFVIAALFLFLFKYTQKMILLTLPSLKAAEAEVVLPLTLEIAM